MSAQTLPFPSLSTNIFVGAGSSPLQVLAAAVCFSFLFEARILLGVRGFTSFASHAKYHIQMMLLFDYTTY